MMLEDPKAAKPVSAVVDGYEVHAYGDFDVLAVGPTYFPNLLIQAANSRYFEKVRPKKSWDITGHVIGMTPRRMPSSAIRGVQLYHPTYFIDGDTNTVGFAGTQQPDPDTRSPAWVRIQLPQVTRIQSVRLVSAKGSIASPTRFEIRTNNWGVFYHHGEWKTVYRADDDRDYIPGIYDWPDRPSYDYVTTKPDTPVRIDLTWGQHGYGEEVVVRECAFETTEAREIWILSPQDF